jgi:D-alanine--poly(phosphoribitol) ligase subunit 2
MTLETNQVAAELRSFIKEHFKVPDSDADFTDDVHLFDYGYIDSFGAVELNSFLEKAFSVKVTESDLIAHPLNTIQEISTFIVQRKAGEI